MGPARRGPQSPGRVHLRPARSRLRLRRHVGSVLRDFTVPVCFGTYTLPPDHLGAACESLAVAIEREEDLLVRELVQRYLAPWCGVAAARLPGHRRTDPVARLPDLLAAELKAI